MKFQNSITFIVVFNNNMNTATRRNFVIGFSKSHFDFSMSLKQQLQLRWIFQITFLQALTYLHIALAILKYFLFLWLSHKCQVSNYCKKISNGWDTLLFQDFQLVVSSKSLVFSFSSYNVALLISFTRWHFPFSR